MALGPAHQLEKLASLGRRLNTSHQLCQRYDLKSGKNLHKFSLQRKGECLEAYLFINSENPASDVWSVRVSCVLDCEDLAIFFRSRVFGPERRIGLQR